ncbi:MAG: glycosyltransferase family 39 protein [Trebonia sp.]
MTISRPEIQALPREASRPAPARQASRPVPPGLLRRQSAPRAVRLAAALAGLAAICAYLFVALSRLGYPFAVESLEGNSLVEVHRILAGQSLYPAPSAGYVPDGYTPLYFYVSAAAARVLGVSYLPLRLVSLVSSLACFAVLARLVQRETGSIAAGVGAAGVFAATYFATGTWFDIARVDSLFLALSIGGLHAARRMRGTGGAIAAGMLLAAAALTKQTGLAEGVVVTAVLLAGPRRRLGCVTAIAEFAVLGISTLALRLTGGGWYTYYVFKQMSEHSLIASNFDWFGKALLTMMGLAVCAALIGARRVPRELLAGCAVLAFEGCAAMVKTGGAINDALPAFLAVALLAGLALGGSSPRWVTAAAGLLVLTQSIILLAGFHPSQAIPASADRAVGERLIAGMRAFGGDVAVPADPALSLLAGMAPAAHPAAASDVLRATDRTAIASFRRSAEEAITTRRFSAFITDSLGAPLYNPPALSRDYHECVQPVPTLLVPVAGRAPRPAVVWIPWRGVSCQAALSILEGGKAARS